jgi:monoamine oxidase
VIIHRRQFLRRAVAAGAPAFLFGQGRNSAAPIVVVGAGLAGLRAAGLLGEAGRQVVVLEARERSGGRVLTIRSPFDDGLSGEAGPIRIAGAHRAVLRAVREHGLTLVPFESSNGAPLDSADPQGVGRQSGASRPPGSGLRTDERGLDARALLERYVGTLPASLAEPAATDASYAAWRDYDRATWPEWLRQRGASPEAVRLMTAGGDSSALSALYMLRQFAMLRSSSQLFKIAGGMDLLPRAMTSALGDVIRYEAAAVRVTRAPASIIIEYETRGRVERLTGSHVVLAVPLSVLRQMEFRPPLSPAKEQAVSAAAYYPGVRILLQSRDRFWNRAGQNGSARTSRTEIWDSAYDRQGLARGMLGATTGGAVGQKFSALTESQSLAFGIDLVAEAFPGIRSAFEKGVVHRWAQDRWARGAFVAFAPGQMTAFMPELARPEDRLHFAGEHTSSWNSWMEGALESGERAAREILGSQSS